MSNLELGSPASWELVLDRLTGGGDRRRPGRAGTASPACSPCRATSELEKSPAENTVTASDDLALEVLVKNSGSSQETQVKVTLTIQQAPEPLKAEQTIQAINPEETKSVTFKISRPRDALVRDAARS